MRAIDREDLIDDPRFATNDARMKHREELDAVIEAWTEDRDRKTVLETMRAADAVVGPVYDIEDVFEDEQFHAREDLPTVEDDDLGTVRTHGTVPKFSETPGNVDRLGGDPGAHNEAVYRGELGLSEAEYERLRENGVI